MALDVIVLAAGKGARMKSQLPKVLHPLAGKPLLGHVLDTAAQLGKSEVSVVTGFGSERVKEAFTARPLHWVEQTQQLGTAHAVRQALPNVRDEATVLILYGDVPLISTAALQTLIDKVSPSAMALLTVDLDNPTGYGRIIRDKNHQVVAIVEEKDADTHQRAIREVNTGVMAVSGKHLREWLPKIGNNNAQGEYYLTDIVTLARQASCEVHAIVAPSAMETQGVNSRTQLQQLERYLQQQFAEGLMDNGTTLADASRFDCRGKLECGEDTFIDVNCIFEGTVVLGNNVRVGANCHIANATIGDNVVIKPNSVIEGPATIENRVDIGPFARIRPGTILRNGSRIGNFVETKKSEIGPGSKVNHLSYIGDASIGTNVNVGAGTITCNYDGVNKFKTVISDGAFIGSNTSLVAPVNIGSDATVGAGSTITRDVDSQQLAVARGRQKNLDNWQRPVKMEKE